MIDLKSKRELNIYDEYEISELESVQYCKYEKVFYVLANKVLLEQDTLGFYIVKINSLNPRDFTFLIKWSNKLNISDANLTMLHDPETG